MGQEKRILHEYQGTLRIIDRRLSLGKIFLDNKKESSVIQFPDTYEDGDRIFVKFSEDDPDCKPVSYYVQNEEFCYGFLISMRDNGGGSIIVNWPKLKGIIFCGKWNAAKGCVPQVKDTVCFIIHRDMSGKAEALKISSAPPEKNI